MYALLRLRALSCLGIFIVCFPLLARQAPAWFGWGTTDRAVAQELRRRGVDLGKLNKRGETGLISATRLGNFPRVRRFLEAGADVGAVSLGAYGRSAFHWACFASDSERSGPIIRLMFDHGADVRTADGHGMAPIHLLARVIDKIDRRLDLMEYLFKNGADINVRNGDGDTILHMAGLNREQLFARAYVSRFGPLIDYTIKNDSRLTSSLWARDLGYVAVAQDIERGESESKNRREAVGLTPLMVAMMRREYDRMPRMIRLGANVAAVSNDAFRRTALHFAILRGDIRAIRLLRDAGASVTVSDANGDRPIHLLAHVVDNDNMSIATAREFLRGIDEKELSNVLNGQDDHRETVLHRAIRFRNRALLTFLVEQYSTYLDIDIENDNGISPRELAQKMGLSFIVETIDRVVSVNRA